MAYNFRLFTFWRCVYRCAHDDWQLYLVCVKLINYTLATEENVSNIPVCSCGNHFPIT